MIQCDIIVIILNIYEKNENSSFFAYYNDIKRVEFLHSALLNRDEVDINRIHSTARKYNQNLLPMFEMFWNCTVPEDIQDISQYCDL